MNKTIKYVAVGALLHGLCAPMAAQEIPPPVLTEALRHVVEHDTLRSRSNFFVVTDRFPVDARAAEAVRSPGLMVHGSRADVVACGGASPEPCRVAHGDQVIDFSRFEMAKDTAVLRLIISTQVVLEDGSAKLFPVLRELTLHRRDGRWRVTDDQVLVRG